METLAPNIYRKEIRITIELNMYRPQTSIMKFQNDVITKPFLYLQKDMRKGKTEYYGRKQQIPQTKESNNQSSQSAVEIKRACKQEAIQWAYHFWTRSTGIWSICDLGLCGLGSVVYPFGWDEAERLPTQHSRETVVLC